MNVFSPEQLAKIVAETLPADAAPGEKVVIGAVDQNGAQVVAAFKFKPGREFGSEWELQAAARHDWDGTNSAGAKVIVRW